MKGDILTRSPAGKVREVGGGFHCCGASISLISVPSALHPQDQSNLGPATQMYRLTPNSWRPLPWRAPPFRQPTLVPVDRFQLLEHNHDVTARAKRSPCSRCFRIGARPSGAYTASVCLLPPLDRGGVPTPPPACRDFVHGEQTKRRRLGMDRNHIDLIGQILAAAVERQPEARQDGLLVAEQELLVLLRRYPLKLLASLLATTGLSSERGAGRASREGRSSQAQMLCC